MKKFCPNFIFALAVCFLCGQILFAQEDPSKQKRPKRVKTEEKVVEIEKTTPKSEESAQTETTKAEFPKEDVKTTTAETVGNESQEKKNEVKADDKTKTLDEEAEITSYYDTALKEYYLGPNDVISVEVFGQPNYSKSNITVPPTGRISYPLIREGVIVKGKTVEQVQEEITKKLDEYIIDPKVTVFLDKAGSARYSILGDVASPGVRVMEQRVTLMDALALAGGMAKTADIKRVTILRGSQSGLLQPMVIDLREVQKGKLVPPIIQPGDQIIVPGKKLSFWERILKYTSVVGFARTFTTGGF